MNTGRRTARCNCSCLLSRGRRGFAGRRRSGSVGRSFAGSGSGVTSGSGRVGGSIARGGGGVARSSGSVGRFRGRFLRGFNRSFFLLGASSERERQRQSGEDHFSVHVNNHPNVM